jgi:hypothetical protein
VGENKKHRKTGETENHITGQLLFQACFPATDQGMQTLIDEIWLK